MQLICFLFHIRLTYFAFYIFLFNMGELYVSANIHMLGVENHRHSQENGSLFIASTWLSSMEFILAG